MPGRVVPGTLLGGTLQGGPVEWCQTSITVEEPGPFQGPLGRSRHVEEIPQSGPGGSAGANAASRCLAIASVQSLDIAAGDLAALI